MVGGQFKTQTLITAFERTRRIVRSEKHTVLKGSIRTGYCIPKAQSQINEISDISEGPGTTARAAVFVPT